MGFSPRDGCVGRDKDFADEVYSMSTYDVMGCYCRGENVVIWKLALWDAYEIVQFKRP